MLSIILFKLSIKNLVKSLFLKEVKTH